MDSPQPRLVFVVGARNVSEVRVVDAAGNPESLAGADRASFRAKESVADLDAASVVSLDTTAGGLSIDVSGSRLLLAPTQLQADAWRPGVYVGEFRVRFGSDLDWRVLERLEVEVLREVAPKV